MTIIIICWLETKNQDQQDVWSLVSKKGKSWLTKNGCDHSSIKPKVVDILK